MCIYYLISFTKSIYFLLNFQIPFMFWITILPLNILYYPTNESIRFSNNLIFLTVLRFIVISATFCQVFAGFSPATFLGFFPAFWLGLGSCFGDFCSFSYFLPVFLQLFESSPNLCVNSSSSYISPSMLPLSSGDLIEWSLVCHSILSYQRFYDLHSIHYDHLEGLHQLI